MSDYGKITHEEIDSQKGLGSSHREIDLRHLTQIAHLLVEVRDRLPEPATTSDDRSEKENK